MTDPSPSGSFALLGRTVRREPGVLLVIACGGAVGSLARWAVERCWPARDGGVPWATLLVNVVGCALLGLLMAVIRFRRPSSRYLRPALGTGVLGGFTTFSAAMAESRALVVHGVPGLAAGYLLASVLIGLAGVWVGGAAGRLVLAGPR